MLPIEWHDIASNRVLGPSYLQISQLNPYKREGAPRSELLHLNQNNLNQIFAVRAGLLLPAL